MIHELFESLLDQDPAPVVICDLDSVIQYMNPSAIRRYGRDLTGQNVKDCHPAAANDKIDKVLAWFAQSKDHNRVYTFRNDKENKDVYMIALRNDSGELIGYYEKHEYRTAETGSLYEME